MHCQFYKGPLDGWVHECPAARIGEVWWVGEVPFEFSPMCFYEKAAHDRSVLNFLPSVARYQLIAPGVMQYQGVLIA